MEVEQKPTFAEKPLQFTGSGGEYFRIWIVNLFLSILTLGIYSAWAKVRRKRYFYGNTLLDGVAFEYLANPVSILKGRLIAVGLLAAYVVTVQMLPLAEPFLGLAFLILLPWLVVRGLTFNARNSAYRNVRFNFFGKYRESAGVFVGWPLLVGLSLGLAYPVFIARRNEFVVNNHRFGLLPMNFQCEGGGRTCFYGLYLGAAGLAILTLIPSVLLLGFVVGSLGPLLPQDPETEQIGVGVLLLAELLPILVMLPVFLIVTGYVKAGATNLLFQHMRCADHQFQSTLKASRMIGLYLTNALAILFSFGLLIPWARVRVTRYRLENLSLLAAGDLNNIATAQQEAIGAAGEEMGELFGVDLGI
jgi:uncharacterized membrane protein YjgN (DUF898 family)